MLRDQNGSKLDKLLLISAIWTLEQIFRSKLALCTKLGKMPASGSMEEHSMSVAHFGSNWSGYCADVLRHDAVTCCSLSYDHCIMVSLLLAVP